MQKSSFQKKVTTTTQLGSINSNQKSSTKPSAVVLPGTKLSTLNGQLLLSTGLNDFDHYRRWFSNRINIIY